ncbi:MAG: hypothetical protein VX181_03010 [Pseudomonadota bacterium]|nr:hypothetical protein [Pseudomonadota bacterium]
MVLLIAFLFLLIAAAWIWLLLGLFKSGKRWIFGALALQLSLIMALITLAMRGGWGAVIGFVWPLLTSVPVTSILITHYAFYADFYYIALGEGLGLALILSILPPLRIWAPLIATTVSMALALPMAEKHSRSLMCKRALALGGEVVERNSFLWSLAHTRVKYMGELHARTIIEDQPYAWSYTLLDWYRVNPLNELQPGRIWTACGKA